MRTNQILIPRVVYLVAPNYLPVVDLIAFLAELTQPSPFWPIGTLRPYGVA
jgi:hypothetical protein